MAEVRDYERDFAAAVGRFWGVREDQVQRQLDAGTVDAGTRGAVTGGQHLNAIHDLLVDVLEDAGVPRHAVGLSGQAATLPGWYRQSKNWDLVVIDGTQVVLTIELKSQVGSFGNNQNNRIEEAVGQAHDYWRASEEVYRGLRPWFGYIMIMEDSPKSSKPVKGSKTLLPTDPIFDNANRMERYARAFERMYHDRILDAATVAGSVKGTAAVTYPDSSLTFQHFAVAVHNRIREYRTVASPRW